MSFQGYSVPKVKGMNFIDAKLAASTGKKLAKGYELHAESVELTRQCEALVNAMRSEYIRTRGFPKSLLEIEIELYAILERLETLCSGSTIYFLQSRDNVYK